MYLIFILVSSFILSFMTITVMKHFAFSFGLVDRPDERKTHHKPTPVVGGIALFVAFLYWWVLLHYSNTASALASIAMFVAVGLLVVEGIWDDKHDRHARHRFIFQIVAAVIMVKWGGLGLYDIGAMFSESVTLTGDWLMPLTVFAVVGGINAFNMADGIDGLAGSLALAAFGVLALLAVGAGRFLDLYLLLTMIGALLAFLFFNLRAPWRKEAKVFLGDAGSMLLGFLLAWSMTHLSQGENRAMPPVMALWLFAIPLFDAVGSIIRRLIHGQSPITADREHIHHMFLSMGFSVEKTVSILIAVAVFFAMTAVVAIELGVREHHLFYAFLGLFTLYVVGAERYWQGKIVNEQTLQEISQTINKRKP